MPQQLFYPNQGLQVVAGAVQGVLAAGSVRLFKSGFTPGITTTVTELIENEANFTGYPAGGLDVDEWQGPYYAPEGGLAIQTGSVTFATGSPVTTPNLIGGWWYQDGNNTAIVIGEFAEGQPMQVPMQQITIQVRLVYPN